MPNEISIRLSIDLISGNIRKYRCVIIVCTKILGCVKLSGVPFEIAHLISPSRSHTIPMENGFSPFFCLCSEHTDGVYMVELEHLAEDSYLPVHAMITCSQSEDYTRSKL